MRVVESAQQSDQLALRASWFQGRDHMEDVRHAREGSAERLSRARAGARSPASRYRYVDCNLARVKTADWRRRFDESTLVTVESIDSVEEGR